MTEEERLKDLLKRSIELLKDAEDYCWHDAFQEEVNELERCMDAGSEWSLAEGKGLDRL